MQFFKTLLSGSDNSNTDELAKKQTFVCDEQQYRSSHDLKLPKQGSLNNYAIIRIWKAKNFGEVGHVSLQTARDYVSLWPRTQASKLRLLDVYLHVCLASFEGDIQISGEPTITVCIYGLNVLNIHTHFERIRQTLNGWKITGTGFIFKDRTHSCTSIVHSLLIAGEIEHLISRAAAEDPKRFIPLALTRPMKAAVTGAVVGSVATASLVAASAATGGGAAVAVIATTGASTATLAAATETLLYDTKTAESDFKSKPTQQLLDSAAAQQYLLKKEYKDALLHFKFPADALELTIPTPEDMERIAYIAKIFDAVTYPETKGYPNQYEEKIFSAPNLRPLTNPVLDSQGLTPLHYALNRKDINTFKTMWFKYPQCRIVKIVDTFETLLHLAIIQRSIEIVEFILQIQTMHKIHDININAQNKKFETALSLSIRLNFTEAALLLLRHGANPGIRDERYFTCLHRAIISSNWEIFNYIWENFPLEREQVTAKGNLLSSAERSALNLAVLKACGDQALATPCSELFSISKILSKPPLENEIKTEKANADRILDAVLQQPDIMYKNIHSALFDATNNIAVFNKLLANNIRLSERHHQFILHHTITLGCLDVAKKIIQWNKKLLEVKENGETPLHIAVSHKKSEMADLLLSLGANGVAKNDQGKTPLELINEEDKDEISEKIRNIFNTYGIKQATCLVM